MLFVVSRKKKPVADAPVIGHCEPVSEQASALTQAAATAMAVEDGWFDGEFESGMYASYERFATVAVARTLHGLADHYAEHGGIFGAAHIVELRRLASAVRSGLVAPRVHDHVGEFTGHRLDHLEAGASPVADLGGNRADGA